MDFKRNIFAYLGMPSFRRKSFKAIVLQRTEGWGLRRILNLNEIIAHVAKKYHIDIDIAEPTSETAVKDQVQLFQDADLIMSTHSSQLFNIFFCKTSAYVIEFVPRLWSTVFQDRAASLHLAGYDICTGSVPASDQCASSDARPLEKLMKSGHLCNLTVPIPVFDACFTTALARIRGPKNSQSQ